MTGSAAVSCSIDSLPAEALKLVESKFHVSAQLPFRPENGLLSAGHEHGIVCQTDTFQELVCSESQSHFAVISGAGAGVFFVLLLLLEVSRILSPMVYGQTTAGSFYHKRTDDFVLIQTLGLRAIFLFGNISSH